MKHGIGTTVLSRKKKLGFGTHHGCLLGVEGTGNGKLDTKGEVALEKMKVETLASTDTRARL